VQDFCGIFFVDWKHRVSTSTQEVRLHKAIAQAGITSRRKAETLITQGRVSVNGRKVTTLGTRVDLTTDAVVVDGRRLPPITARHYILLHKPRGYVTTCDDDQGRPTVFDLLKRQKVRLFPVGRLDVNTEGVLLLTNDGALAHRLMHPRYHIPRVYLVKVYGLLTEQDIIRLRQGVVLDDGKTLPAEVELLRRGDKTCLVRLTLYEGRHRQIHRMLEHCGPYRVNRLQRIGMGPLTVRGLALGSFRSLEAFEVARLQQAVRLRRTTRRG
jgi:pseudouridine synthase